MNVRYSRRALSQLASVHEYLQARSATAADWVTASIRSTVARLRELPLLGKPTDEADVHVLIEPEYLYRVFYTVNGEEVFCDPNSAQPSMVIRRNSEHLTDTIN